MLRFRKFARPMKDQGQTEPKLDSEIAIEAWAINKVESSGEYPEFTHIEYRGGKNNSFSWALVEGGFETVLGEVERAKQEERDRVQRVRVVDDAAGSKLLY